MNIWLATKTIKKLDLCAYSFQKWVYIKDISIKLNACILIKVEKMFDKYMKIWEKASNITKNKFSSELVYNKKYLKAKNKFNTKEKKISMFL